MLCVTFDAAPQECQGLHAPAEPQRYACFSDANTHDLQSKMTNTSNRDNHDGAAQFLRDFVHWTPGNTLPHERAWHDLCSRALCAHDVLRALRYEARLRVSRPHATPLPHTGTRAHEHAPHMPPRCPLAPKCMLSSSAPPLGLTACLLQFHVLFPVPPPFRGWRYSPTPVGAQGFQVHIVGEPIESTCMYHNSRLFNRLNPCIRNLPGSESIQRRPHVVRWNSITVRTGEGKARRANEWTVGSHLCDILVFWVGMGHALLLNFVPSSVTPSPPCVG